VAWACEDEDDGLALSALTMLDQSTAVVPAIWELEVVNALVVAGRGNRITSGEISEFLANLADLPIEGTHAVPTMAEMAEGCTLTGLTAYDYAYLHVALVEGLPLATLDRRLATAAAHVGVALVTDENC